MPRLSKSGVEYLDYSWGIWSGCLNLQTGSCPIKACWAKGIANHYPKLYPDGFEPHFYPEAIDSPKHLKKSSIISVGWVGDVIGYGLKYRDQIFETIGHCPQHRFLFLTKNPERLSAWGSFPDNCWVGVTATDELSFQVAAEFLLSVNAPVKYLSFEPLLEWGSKDFLYSTEELLKAASIKWVIIGAQTKPTVYPKIEWAQEIVEAADKAGVAVFLKNNLAGLLTHQDSRWAYSQDEDIPEMLRLRQEMPCLSYLQVLH